MIAYSVPILRLDVKFVKGARGDALAILILMRGATPSHPETVPLAINSFGMYCAIIIVNFGNEDSAYKR